MRDVVVLGAQGMLAQAFRRSTPLSSVTYLTKAECNITDLASLERSITPGSTVLNFSAYTKVDDAETHVEDAFHVNAEGVRNLALTAVSKNARIIHISTDYVFDGTSTAPYGEESKGNPRTAYGQTKWQGEQFLREIMPESSVILRTAWLYAHPGTSFVHTMLRLSQERDFVDVVNDQIGQPTWAVDVTRMINRILEADISSGVFHATNAGAASWYDFAQEIFRHAGLDPERIRPTTTDKFPRPAQRPASSVLGHRAWQEQFGWQPRPWTEALSEAWKSEFSLLFLQMSNDG